jgi:hypothetical protein
LNQSGSEGDADQPNEQGGNGYERDGSPGQ